MRKEKLIEGIDENESFSLVFDIRVCSQLLIEVVNSRDGRSVVEEMLQGSRDRGKLGMLIVL